MVHQKTWKMLYKRIVAEKRFGMIPRIPWCAVMVDGGALDSRLARQPQLPHSYARSNFLLSSPATNSIVLICSSANANKHDRLTYE
jgi:hypothetical protein